jgi:hypothetical protein
MIRLATCLLCTLLLAAGSRAVAATAVSESDLKKYQELEYAKAVREAWKMYARADKAKQAAADAEYARVRSAAGWTDERYGAIDEAIGEVLSALSSAKSGDITADELKSTLAECDPVTVAAVKAHFDELNTPNNSERAEKQVRDAIAEERAGAVPTPAQLAGKWVFDADATVKDALGGLGSPEDTAKLKADMIARAGNPWYVFGPGNQIESHSKGTSGGEVIFRGTFRIEGHKMFFKAENQKREESLQAGIRDGKLLLGMFGINSVFTRG